MSELNGYDFCKKYDAFLAHQTLPKKTHTRRTPSISGSKIITIILLFHQSPAKNFKYFYESYLPRYTTEFPKMVSYNRFIELQQRYLGHIYSLPSILRNDKRIFCENFNLKIVQE